MPLTAIAIQNAKPAEGSYRLNDGNSLYLEVRPSGVKAWLYRYKIRGKENIFTIGQFCPAGADHISVHAARLALGQARELVKQGIHPTQHRRNKERAEPPPAKHTFRTVAEEWLAKKASNWSEQNTRQIRRVLVTDVYPTIGALYIKDVTAHQILEIMQKVEARGAASFAHLIRQWVSAIYRYAIATLRVENDPTYALRGAIARRPVQHSRALSKAELMAFLVALEGYRGEPNTILGFQLMLLTFVRRTELCAARWEEFNLSTAEWRIPAHRMKMRDQHIVPLSRQSLTILDQLKIINGHREFVFPNSRNPHTYMAPNALNDALRRMGFGGDDTIGFSTHGFRSTACTMLNEAGFRSDIIDLQLSHKERNHIRAAYNRAVHLNERRVMMQSWADMIDAMKAPDSSAPATQPVPGARPVAQDALASFRDHQEPQRPVKPLMLRANETVH
jgi:integrase